MDINQATELVEQQYKRRFMTLCSTLVDELSARLDSRGRDWTVVSCGSLEQAQVQ